MRCRAVVEAPGFHGDLRGMLARADIESFRSQSAASVRRSGSPCHARLTSDSPDIDVALPSGKVEGQYEFGGFGPHLPTPSGDFEADRAGLAPLLSGLDRVLGEADWPRAVTSRGRGTCHRPIERFGSGPAQRGPTVGQSNK